MKVRCPQCGVGTGVDRVNEFRARPGHNHHDYRDPSVWGIHYDYELREWSCVECGCQFKENGDRRDVVAEYDEEAVTWGIRHKKRQTV